MEIVPAGPDTDVATEAIVDLWVDLAADQRAHGSHLDAEGNRTRIREAIVRHAVDGGVLVARDREAGDLLGFVMFARETATYAQDLSRGIVENLYVRPAQRGEGVGSALLEAAEDALAERGLDAVTLEVMAANEDARRLYRRRGYEEYRVELEKPLASDTHSKGGK